MEPKIDPEFKALLAPLSAEQYAGLEEDILDRGCLDTIKLWNDTIIDGHNRFSICMRHGVIFQTEDLEFDSREDVIEWMIRNQLNRRNQTPEQISYFRGKLNEQEKKSVGRPAKLAQNEPISGKGSTAEKIGKEFGVSATTIKRDSEFAKAIDAIAEHVGQDVKHQILLGELPVTKKDVLEIASLPDKEREVAIEFLATAQANPLKERPHVTNNSGNNEWYTPSDYIEAARRAMGSIDVDPASSPIANRTVKASTFYTAEDNGLAQIWHGNVWLNPPYSSDLIGQFIDRLIDSIKDNETEQAILLVNNATETGWFQKAASVASFICFPKGRIRYLNHEGHPANTPLQGQAFLYYGDNGQRFKDIFKSFGLVVIV